MKVKTYWVLLVCSLFIVSMATAGALNAASMDKADSEMKTAASEDGKKCCKDAKAKGDKACCSAKKDKAKDGKKCCTAAEAKGKKACCSAKKDKAKATAASSQGKASKCCSKSKAYKV